MNHSSESSKKSKIFMALPQQSMSMHQSVKVTVRVTVRVVVIDNNGNSSSPRTTSSSSSSSSSSSKTLNPKPVNSLAPPTARKPLTPRQKWREDLLACGVSTPREPYVV